MQFLQEARDRMNLRRQAKATQEKQQQDVLVVKSNSFLNPDIVFTVPHSWATSSHSRQCASDYQIRVTYTHQVSTYKED